MRVHVDDTLCAATGQCEMICPDVFEVEEVALVLVPEPGPELHESVREAGTACPTGAIILET